MTAFQSKAYHPRTGYTDTPLALLTLTLSRWPWYRNLT